MKVIAILLTPILLLSFNIKAQDVKIGTQTWTSKNLNVSTYRNGDKIPQVQDKKAWSNLKTGAWCYYENNTANGTTYGKLYNWYAVCDPRGLAPNGYHIPTDNEWTILTDYLGGESVAGTKMKSSSGWKNNGNGTNTSRFAGLPGGFRSYDRDFFNIGAGGYWWSSSEFNTSFAWYRNLYFNDGNVNRDNANKHYGFSVRCIKDCSNDYPPNIELNKRNAEEKKGEAIYNWWLEMAEKDIEQSDHKTKSKRREQSNRPNWECTHCHKVSYQDQKPDHPWGDEIECQEAYDRFNKCCGWHAWVEIN